MLKCTTCRHLFIFLCSRLYASFSASTTSCHQQAVWITDGMSSLCLQETTFWHIQRRVKTCCLSPERHFPGDVRTLSKCMPANTKIKKMADSLGQCAGQRAIHTNQRTCTQDRTAGTSAGSRQHFGTSLSSSCLIGHSFTSSVPSGRAVWRTGMKEAANVFPQVWEEPPCNPADGREESGYQDKVVQMTAKTVHAKWTQPGKIRYKNKYCSHLWLTRYELIFHITHILYIGNKQLDFHH